MNNYIEFIILGTFIISSLISGTICFISEYKKNKKLSNDNPFKDDTITLFMMSYTMGGIVVGFFVTLIIGFILIGMKL